MKSAHWKTLKHSFWHMGGMDPKSGDLAKARIKNSAFFRHNEKRWFEIAESYMKSIVLIQHDMQVRDGRQQVLAKPSRLQVTIPTKAE